MCVLISFSPQLDDQVCEPPVEYGIKGVDMHLVEASCSLTVRREERVRIVRVAEDVNGGPITGNEQVFAVVKLLFQAVVKCIEEVGKSRVSQFSALLVKCGFRGYVCVASEVTVNLLFDAIRLHGE